MAHKRRAIKAELARTLGSDYYPEPLMAAKTLAKLTRKELV